MRKVSQSSLRVFHATPAAEPVFFKEGIFLFLAPVARPGMLKDFSQAFFCPE